MKLKLLLPIILVIFLSIDIFSQNYISLRLKGTYNFFSMTDETSLQNDLLNDVKYQGIPAAATESFPPYYGMQFQFIYVGRTSSGKEFHIGVFIDQASTGAKINYKDYSGEIKIDQLFKAYSFGPIGETNVDLGNNFHLNPGLSIPLIFSYFQVKNNVTVGNITSSRQIDFSAFAFGVEPGISLSYYLHNVMIGINFDYLITFPSSYSLENNSEEKLLNKSGDPVNMGMNGPRIGLTLGYIL